MKLSLHMKESAFFFREEEEEGQKNEEMAVVAFEPTILTRKEYEMLLAAAKKWTIEAKVIQ